MRWSIPIPCRTMIDTIAIHRGLMLLCAVITFGGCAAQYDGPESVEYDPVGDRYFVSNTQSELILIQDQDGEVSTFTNTWNAPYGMEILDGVLFVCSQSDVIGFYLDGSSSSFPYSFGATFLNGITTDGEFLYVTDFAQRRIFKVDPWSLASSVLVDDVGGTPNGIVWDPVGERLIVVYWQSNSPIRSFDRNSGAMTTLLSSTDLTNLDGITIDCDGNFLVSSWSPDHITSFEPTFTQPGVNLGITGLNNPADIDFDTVNNRVCVPNSGSNTVTIEDVDCSNAIQERDTYTALVMPNPTNGLVRFEPSLKRAEPFMVLDVGFPCFRSNHNWRFQRAVHG